MATSRSVSTRELVGTQALTYIKPINVRVDVSDVRPNTTLYAYFDGVLVNGYCRQIINPTVVEETISESNLSAVGTLLSSAAGRISFIFYIPGGKFTTGDKMLFLTDTTSLEELDIPGNLNGSASSTFYSKGTQQIYQSTTTTITTVVIENRIERSLPATSPVRDPVAQSFFTYGATGGIFVTGVDLYFQSKDTSIPVRVELRKMVNGLPSPLEETNPDLIASIDPANVQVSNDASLPTRFQFPVPVYLPENDDYCFVVFSNSNKYMLWMSRMGERANETGNIIFEQPYVGSLFKSENNITWTAEQFEDLKFTLYKAQFDTSVASNITFVATAPSYTIAGPSFSTTNNSAEVTVRTPTQHGLTVGSKIGLSVDVGGTYNGIAAVNLNGNRGVTRVIDEYVFTFTAGAAATSSGTLQTGGIVYAIAVVNGGSGYSSLPTVIVSAPPSGTTAVAAATVVNGEIVAINIVNKGSGYVFPPAITITDSTGTGAVAVSATTPIFTITPNKVVHTISPQIAYSVTEGSNVSSTYRGVSPSYALQNAVDFPFNHLSYFEEPSLIASRINEFDQLSNSNSVEIQVTMTTSNTNVSPIIDTRTTPSLMVMTNAINDQTQYESTSSSNQYATVDSFNITNGGSGYTSATVTVIPAENETNTSITAATGTAVIVSGVITEITKTSDGSGYTKPPIVIITGDGTNATATATVTTYNSEIGTQGTAFSRYLTKRVVLQTPSTDIKLISTIHSTPETSVDWYIRTSLSSDSTKHDDNPWQILSCDVERNRSKKKGQFFEYDFYTSGLSEFDTYDLKCVFRSINSAKTPYVKRYRVIALV